jgi:hypothetical protein
MFKNIQENLDRYYSDSYNIASNTWNVLEREGNETQYKEIAKRLGVSSTSTGDIVIGRKVIDGVPVEGKLEVKILPKAGTKPEDMLPIHTGIEVDDSKLADLVVLDTKKYRYSLDNPHPKNINLGNGYYGGMEAKGFDSKTLPEVIDYSVGNGGDEDKARQIANEYKAGKYEVRLVGDKNQGSYGYRVYYSGTEKQPNNEFFLPLQGLTTLPDNAVAEFQERPKPVVDGIMREFINYKSGR